MFGEPVVWGVRGVAPLFAAEGGFGEGGEVEAGGVVGGEVGGEEEVVWCLGEGEGGWGAGFSVGFCCRRDQGNGGNVDIPLGGFDLPVSGLVETGMILSVKAASLWKRLRFLTISLEKSRGP